MLKIDAASSPCFNVKSPTGFRRVSLVDILSQPNADMCFAGPTELLETCQLMLAANITADILGSDAKALCNEDLSKIADVVLARIQANPHRFLLNGDGHRYLQVPQTEDRVKEIDSRAMEENFFPNFAVTAIAEKVSFGLRSMASPDGFCPTCAMLGLNFATKFSAGTGGKIAGLWKSGALTFPIYASLRDTVLINALAWLKLSISDMPEGDVDPWADDTYLKAVSLNGPWSASFRTKRHLRSFTPWALWLGWEHKPGSTCTLCGLASDHVASSMQAPIKLETGYTGKLGWPKILRGKTMVNDVVPSPWTALREKKDDVLFVLPTRTNLLSQIPNLVKGAHAAPSLDVRATTDHMANEEGFYSILVSVIFNDHKATGSYDFTTHIPTPLKSEDRISHLVGACQTLDDKFQLQKSALFYGLTDALSEMHNGKNTISDAASGIRSKCMELFSLKGLSFVDFLDLDGPERWWKFLRKEALHIFHQAVPAKVEPKRLAFAYRKVGEPSSVQAK